MASRLKQGVNGNRMIKIAVGLPKPYQNLKIGFRGLGV